MYLMGILSGGEMLSFFTYRRYLVLIKHVSSCKILPFLKEIKNNTSLFFLAKIVQECLDTRSSLW